MSLDFRRAFALFELQLELECTRILDGNRLVPFACPNPDLPNRVVVVRFHDRSMVFLRDDVDETAADRLLMSPPGDMERAVSRVRELADLDVEWSGSTYVVMSPFDAELTEGVSERPGDQENGGRSFCIIDGDEAVSGCSSSRENDSAAEAWVWTHERVRRRGYGQRCVAAWANDLLRQGKVPFYSHEHDNEASRQLARSLGLTWVFDACGFD